MRKFLYSLLVLFSLLLFKGCDVLNGVPDPNLIDKIDQELEWQNAKKLEVTIDFNEDWGESKSRNSNFQYTGDARAGFPFEVDFTPNDDFALIEWRIYKTSDFEKIVPDKEYTYKERWKYDVKLLEQLEMVAKYTDVDPFGNGSIIDGMYEITIDLEEPVTLIPFSNEQPRVRRWDRSTTNRPRGVSTSIQFAGLLDHDPADTRLTTVTTGVVLRTGARSVVIEQVDSDGTVLADLSNLYNADFNLNTKLLTVNIDGKTTPPADSLIRLSLREGITTLRGKPLPKDYEKYSYTWKTFSSDIGQIRWVSKYDNSNRKINVKVYYSGDIDTTSIVLYWTRSNMDKINPDDSGTYTVAEDQNPVMDSSTGEWVFNFDIDSDVASYDRTPGSSKGYQFQIVFDNGEEVLDRPEDLGEFSNFYMFNIPGLEVTSANPIIRVDNLNTFDFTAETNNNQIFVFDYEYSGNYNNTLGIWTPIGSSASPFRGKFYGMGRTVTVNAAFNNSDYLGLFGYTNEAEIQDLNVVYNAQTITNAHFGGIAGYAENTIIKDTTVRYDSTISLSSTTDRNWGGAVGLVKGTSKIQNVNVTGTGGLNVISSTATVYLGGLAGKVEDVTVEGESPAIENSSSAINVSAVMNNSIYAGGLAGLSYGKIKTSYTTGDVDITINSNNSIYVGGLAGRAGDNNPNKEMSIESSWASGEVTVKKTATGTGQWTLVGGLAGVLSRSSISNSYATGNVSVNDVSNSSKYVGGLVGEGNHYSNISYCFSRGDVEVINSGGGNTYAGGVVGYFTGSPSSNDNPGLKNNAALGTKVTAQGSGTLQANRVFGNASNITIGSNYARTNMGIGTASSGTPATAIPTTDIEETKKNGKDVLISSLMNNAFWTRADLMAFNNTIWDISILTMGHPRLINVGVQPTSYTMIVDKEKVIASTPSYGTITLEQRDPLDNAWSSFASGTDIERGMQVRVTANYNKETNGGYVLKDLTSNDVTLEGSGTGSGTFRTFVMPEKEVTVTATYTPPQDLFANITGSGEIKVNDSIVTSTGIKIPVGDTVTINITATSGYKITNISATSGGSAYTLGGGTTLGETATRTITAMPDNSVTINVTFARKQVHFYTYYGNTVVYSSPSNGIEHNSGNKYYVNIGTNSLVKGTSSTTPGAFYNTDSVVNLTISPAHGYYASNVEYLYRRSGVSGDHTIKNFDNGSLNTEGKCSCGSSHSLAGWVSETSYKIPNDAEDSSASDIKITFAQKSFTVTPSYETDNNGNYFTIGDLKTYRYDDEVVITAITSNSYRVTGMTYTRSDTNEVEDITFSRTATTNYFTGRFSIPNAANDTEFTVKVTFSNTYTITGNIPKDNDGVTIGSYTIESKANGVDTSTSISTASSSIQASSGQEVKITPSTPLPANYRISEVTVEYYSPDGWIPLDSLITGSGDSPRTFIMISYDLNVYVTYERIPSVLTLSGTINGTYGVWTASSGGTQINNGNNALAGLTYYVRTNPSDNYKVKSVTYTPSGGTATNATVVTANSVYSFTMPAVGTTINVEFELITSTITKNSATPAGVGSYDVYDSSTGGTAVSSGAAGTTYYVRPTITDTNYKIKSVTYTPSGGTATNATVVTANSVYSFTMPAVATTINVEFERITSTITKNSATPVGIGSYDVYDSSTGGTAVSSGAAGTTYYVRPTITDTNYKIKSVTYTPSGGTATNATVVTANEVYSFTMPAVATAINVEFELITSAITQNTTANGSYTVWTGANTGNQIPVNGGTGQASVIYYIRTVSNNNYRVDTVKITSGDTTTDATVVTANSIYSFTMPANAVTINVNFTNQYKITNDVYNPINIGSTNINDITTGTYGTEVSFTATPIGSNPPATVTIKDSFGNTITPTVTSAGTSPTTYTYKFTITNTSVTEVNVDISFNISLPPGSGAYLRSPTTERFTNNRGSGFRVINNEQLAISNEQLMVERGREVKSEELKVESGKWKVESGAVNTSRQNDVLAQKIINRGVAKEEFESAHELHELTRINEDVNNKQGNMLMIPYATNNSINRNIEEVAHELHELTRIEEDAHGLHGLARIRNILILAMYLCLANVWLAMGIRKRLA